MIDQACVEIIRDSIVKVTDSGRCVYFRNTERQEFRRIRIDGCVVVDGKRADYVVEHGIFALVIELKGKNVEKAVEQVRSTAALWKVEGRAERLSALIVAREYPRASSTMQSKTLAFLKEFKAPLHVCSDKKTYTIEDLFKFRPNTG